MLVLLIIYVMMFIFKYFISHSLAKRYTKSDTSALTNENITESIINIPEIKKILYDHEDSYLKLAYGNLLKNSSTFEEAIKFNAFYKVLVNDNYVISINNKIAIAKSENYFRTILNIIQLAILLGFLSLLFMFIIHTYQTTIHYTMICVIFICFSISTITFSFYSIVYRIDPKNARQDMNFSQIISGTGDEENNNFKIVEVQED